ncbi:MAG: pyruvate kinase alpha/beta domain-containing protein [Chloroflexota bacterium]
MELKVAYFEQKGKENSEEVLRLARQRADELGITSIVVASTVGDTAVRAVDVFQGMKVVVVTHAAGFHEPNTQEFTAENRKAVEDKGGIVLTSAHAFGGISRAIKNKFATVVTGDIIAQTLRIFGQGTKVVCEIALMAADSGLVRTDEDLIAVAGSGRGADTAMVIRPACSHNFFELVVREVLCKPRL